MVDTHFVFCRIGPDEYTSFYSRSREGAIKYALIPLPWPSVAIVDERARTFELVLGAPREVSVEEISFQLEKAFKERFTFVGTVDLLERQN